MHELRHAHGVVLQLGQERAVKAGDDVVLPQHRDPHVKLGDGVKGARPRLAAAGGVVRVVHRIVGVLREHGATARRHAVNLAVKKGRKFHILYTSCGVSIYM